MSSLCTALLWVSATYMLWRAAGPVCRRLNIRDRADRAIVGMVLGFFGLVAGLSAVAAIA